MSQTLSSQEKALLQQIKEGQQAVNEIFKQLEIKKSDIVDRKTNQDSPQQHMKNNQKDIYLQKYQKYSIQQIRKKYDEALPMFGWFQLPFCKKIIYEKMLFFIPANVFIIITYSLWRKKSQKIKPLTWKNYGKMYAGLTALTWGLVFAESILFQPYCDINSNHYNRSLTNRQIAKHLKKEYDRYDGKK